MYRVEFIPAQGSRQYFFLNLKNEKIFHKNNFYYDIEENKLNTARKSV